MPDQTAASTFARSAPDPPLPLRILRYTTFALALFLAAIACAQRPTELPRLDPNAERDPLANEPWLPTGEARVCETSPPAAASVTALLDSAAVVDGLAPETAPAGHVLLAIAYDENGTPADVRVLERSMRATGIDVESVVRGALRRQPGATYARLRIDVAVAPQGYAAPIGLRLGGTQYCPPALRNRLAVRSMMGAVGREGTVALVLYIDQTGVVQEREVVTSSGDETTDGIALGLVGSMRYDPAYSNGYRCPLAFSTR